MKYGRTDRLNNSEDRSRFPVTRDSLLSALCSVQSVSAELAKIAVSIASCGLVSREAHALPFQWGSNSGPRFNLAQVAVLFVTSPPHPHHHWCGYRGGGRAPTLYRLSCPNERRTLSGLPNRLRIERVRRGDLLNGTGRELWLVWCPVGVTLWL